MNSLLQIRPVLIFVFYSFEEMCIAFRNLVRIALKSPQCFYGETVSIPKLGTFCNRHGPALNDNAGNEKLEVNVPSVVCKEIPYHNISFPTCS